MAGVKIKLKRGHKSGVIAYTPDIGEPVFDLDRQRLYIGDANLPEGYDIGAEELVVTQTFHGFSVADVIRFDSVSNTYVKAVADSEIHARSIGIVSKVVDSSTFVLSSGRVILSGSPGLTPGKLYYLSDTVSGQIISEDVLPPSLAILDPVLFTVSSNEGIFFKFSPPTSGLLSSSVAAFLEIYTVDTNHTPPYEMSIPNGNSYEVGGKVLEVYRNGVRLAYGIDYEETDSRHVTFLVSLHQDEILIFTAGSATKGTNFFGDWEARNSNEIYQADADGFIIGNVYAGNSDPGNWICLKCFTSPTSPPTSSPIMNSCKAVLNGYASVSNTVIQSMSSGVTYHNATNNKLIVVAYANANGAGQDLEGYVSPTNNPVQVGDLIATDSSPATGPSSRMSISFVVPVGSYYAISYNGGGVLLAQSWEVGGGGATADENGSFCMPIKKNWYYEVVLTQSGSNNLNTIYWVPAFGGKGSGTKFLELYTPNENKTASWTLTIPGGNSYATDGLSLQIYKNGVRLAINDDYVETTETTVDMLVNVSTQDVLIITELTGPMVDHFIQLVDAPSSYVSHGGKVVCVKNDESGVNFNYYSGLSTQTFQAADGTTGNQVVNISQFPLTHAGVWPDVYGYTKLPNGLIMQWGTYNTVQTTEIILPMSFPLAFPNACLFCMVSPWDLGGGADDMIPAIYTWNSTNFYVFCNWEGPPTNPYMDGFLWFALGF